MNYVKYIVKNTWKFNELDLSYYSLISNFSQWFGIVSNKRLNFTIICDLFQCNLKLEEIRYIGIIIIKIQVDSLID